MGLGNVCKTVAVTIACLGFAAISSDALSQSKGASPASPVAQGISDSAIKIGLLGPFSGPSATYGKAIHTIDAVYQEVNANGGINGRKIETANAWENYTVQIMDKT